MLSRGTCDDQRRLAGALPVLVLQRVEELDRAHWPFITSSPFWFSAQTSISTK